MRRRQRRLRLTLPRRGACSTLLAVAFGALAAGSALPARDAAPTDSTPLTISYAGTFDLTNTMVPQGMQHSYDYRIQWAYSWSGTWGELFGGGSISDQTSFASSHISGAIHAIWRANPTGPELKCTLRIVPNMSDYPDFRALYDSSRGTIRIAGLASPTYRYAQEIGSSDPMCGGGPAIDILGAPTGWNPSGEPSVTLGVTGGVHDYDRTWSWKHAYGVGAQRNYASSMHASTKVTLPHG